MSEPTIVLTEAIALELWQVAATQELGLKIPIALADLEKVRAMLWRVRQQSGDPALEELKLITAPGGTEVWILKKTAELP